MKVFISWSGDRSKKVARALYEWIPSVIQSVKPWMSEQIAKGARWNSEVSRELEDTRFGIVCLTPENLNAPWIHFETGALSKPIEKTHVCPYLLGVRPIDIREGPLTQFQTANADQKDTLGLVKSINLAQGSESALSEKSIESAFKKWWPELEKELQEISRQSPASPDREKRDEMDVLEEILDTVRQLSRDTLNPVWVVPGNLDLLDTERNDLTQKEKEPFKLFGERRISEFPRTEVPTLEEQRKILQRLELEAKKSRRPQPKK